MSSSSSVTGRSGAEWWIVKSTAAVLLLLMLSPILMVIFISFTDGNTLQFPPPDYSLRWYREVWGMLAGQDAGLTRLGESIVASVEIAALTSIVTIVTGVPASYVLTRYRFSGKAVTEELIGFPVIFPAVVLGIALLVLFSGIGIDLGVFQIVTAHSIIGLPFLMRNCMAAMRGIDRSLEEAAQTLGASPLRMFREVVLPLAAGGIASGAILVFILSFNEFTLSYFLYTVDIFPLPIWLFQQANTSFSPAVFAISALMVVINVGAVLILDTLASARMFSKR
ncbi:ABC transporter permease [Sinorhizobium fredii]|uniref:ABC transporter permease n=1 Tax=Rhizobium fredii TaxID=380 RepID=UPI000563360E|nr:ABC transporter permease [Sinorhizobium fredii]